MTASRSHATQYVVAGLIAVVAFLLSALAWPGAEDAGGEEATKVSSDPDLTPAPEQRQWTRRLEATEKSVEDGDTAGGDPLPHLPDLEAESKAALAGIFDGLAGPRHLQRQHEIVTMALDGIAEKLAKFTKIRQTRPLTEEELREEAKYLERQYLWFAVQDTLQRGKGMMVTKHPTDAGVNLDRDTHYLYTSRMGFDDRVLAAIVHIPDYPEWRDAGSYREDLKNEHILTRIDQFNRLDAVTRRRNIEAYLSFRASGSDDSARSRRYREMFPNGTVINRENWTLRRRGP